MTHPDIAALAQVPLFEGLSEDVLATLAARMEVETHPAGRTSARTGAHGYAFFVLGSGAAHAELEGEVLEVLEPGSVFGEMALFNPDSRREADVVADTPITIYSMFGTDFRTMTHDLPEVAQRLQALYEERAARVNAHRDDA
jgi:CRP-like cAMP-binding protein